MKKIRAFQINNHGVDHAQYFPGVGVAVTSWDDGALGAGENAKEAYDDAVEQLAMYDWDVARLPTRPRGIRKTDSVDAHIRSLGENPKDRADDCELHYYVSVFVKSVFVE